MSVPVAATFNAKAGPRAAVSGCMGMDADCRSVDCCRSR